MTANQMTEVFSMTNENGIQFPDESESRRLWAAASFTRRTLLLGFGGLGAAAALAACSPGGTSPDPNGAASGTPKRGGNFRVGVLGGGSKDILDGQNFVVNPDAPRLMTAFETLLTRDENFRLSSDGLAESVEADNPTQYTIKLRKGVQFHNGKTMTADDVIYSLQRIGNDKTLRGHSATVTWDIAGITKIDDYTVRLPLKSADSSVPDTLAAYYFGIVPVDYKPFSGDPSTQIGTGPYKLKSFTPGQESVHERNPNYWREGQPYFDTVTIIDFSDATAQVNALLAGQIDAATDLPSSQVAAVQASGQQILESQTGWWVGLSMMTTMAPFDDSRVRQAFRLVVDRQSMLDQVASGKGQIGNDLYGRYDAAYFDKLPQRQRDIEKAKSLLKEAGKENLSVDLYTADLTDGMVSMATVFARQAKDAGITVNVKVLPNDKLYSDEYLYKVAFTSAYWAGRPYLDQVKLSGLSNSLYPETQWSKSESGPEFEALYKEALETTDEAKRTEALHKMQQLEYDNGGYIIPYFPSKFDGHTPSVQGLTQAKTTLGLNNYGYGFRTIWLA